MDNRKISIKGVNWFGLENPQYALHGLWSVNMEGVLDMLKREGFNALRVPFSLELSLGLDTLKCTSINLSANPTMKDFTAGQMLDKLCEECERRGILIMPDLHRLTGDGIITEWIYNAEFGEKEVLQGWLNIVRRCKRFPNVFAMDIKNEPHGSARWSDWKAVVQVIGNAILAENPKVLIVAEGVEVSNDGEGSWWGGNLKDVAHDPIVLDTPNKLVYSPHVYGPDVFDQPYFANAAFPENLPEMWDRHFGYISKTRAGAILIGEWGGHAVPGSKDHVWQTRIAQYIRENAMDQFYWCVNPNSGDTGGILQEDWKTVHRHKLDIIHLASPNPTAVDFGAPLPPLPPLPPQAPPAPAAPVYVPPPPPPPAPMPPAPMPPAPMPPAPMPPAPQSLPGSIELDVKEVSIWKDNGTEEYRRQYVVNIINTGSAPQKNVAILVDSDGIEQIWNMKETAEKGRYVLPAWLTESYSVGIPANGGAHNFGFICKGKAAAVRIA
jgi:endoglucanase